MKTNTSTKNNRADTEIVRTISSSTASAGKPILRVLHLLKNVTKGTMGWTALCPAHDDNLNSLSVAEGDDGRVLLFCHAGCSLNEVVAALGIRVRDLFVQRRGRR
jgi:hypothetical protein